MKYYFCLVKKEDDVPLNMGYKYIKDHESDWIEGNNTIYEYLTAGYVKGIDFVVKDAIAYMIWKSYIMPDEDCVVILAKESSQACDTISFAERMEYIENHRQTAEVKPKETNTGEEPPEESDNP